MSDVTRTAGVAGTFPYELLDANGAHVTPAEPPVLTIYADADRTVVAVAAQVLAEVSAGVYTATYPATLAAGTYYLAFDTVLVEGQPPLPDRDDQLILSGVEGSVVPRIVTLTQVKQHLAVGGAGVPARIGTAPANASDDAALQVLIDSAEALIADLAGPVLPETVVEVHDGGRDTVCLYRFPVLQVLSVIDYAGGLGTSLVESTPAAPRDGYQLDAHAGLIIRVSGFTPRPFTCGSRNVQVAYTAGRARIPASVVDATCELVAHWWRQRRGGAAGFPPAGEPGFNAGGGFGYGIPNRVLDRLGHERAIPSIG